MIIRNKLIPFKGYCAINLFGIIFARKGAKVSKATINHEGIHTAQMKEMLFVFFYLWYIVEYLIRLIIYWNHSRAYTLISFEQEAYDHERESNYLKQRDHYSWWQYLVRK